jgi:flagellar biosynthetic protein FlhB
LVTAAVLLGLFMVLHRLHDGLYSSLATYMAESLSTVSRGELSVGLIMAWGLETILFLVRIVAPIFLVAVTVGLTANVLQVGWVFSAESITPKFEKIDPLKGFQRLFSPRALVELAKSLLKVGIIGWVAYRTVAPSYEMLMGLSDQETAVAFGLVENIIYTVGIRVGIALLVLALLDYAYQRWDYERSLKMSKQEVRDEFKDVEGDPRVKGQIKQKQRQMAMRRMMQQVPQADVVITNPTHIAVALKYDQQKMKAPEIVAMGADYVAERIRTLARESGVAIVENRPLARALYQTAEVGRAVPIDLYQAVAEVLAFVYRLKRRRA